MTLSRRRFVAAGAALGSGWLLGRGAAAQGDQRLALPSAMALAFEGAAPDERMIARLFERAGYGAPARIEAYASAGEFVARLGALDALTVWGPASTMAFAPEGSLELLFQVTSPGDLVLPGREGESLAVRQMALYAHTDDVPDTSPGSTDVSALPALLKPGADQAPRRLTVALLDPISVEGYLIPQLGLRQLGWKDVAVVSLRDSDETLAALRAGVVHVAVGPLEQARTASSADLVRLLKLPPAPTPAVFAPVAQAGEHAELRRRLMEVAPEVFRPMRLSLGRGARAPYADIARDARVWYAADRRLPLWGPVAGADASAAP